MLNVENITKNVEMLKNVGTKINFFDANNFIFDKKFKKFSINPYFYQHLFSALVLIISFMPNFHFVIIINIIGFKKKLFTFHSNRVKCEKQILPSVGFEPTTSCIRGKRLTAKPREPHGRERTTPRLI